MAFRHIPRASLLGSKSARRPLLQGRNAASCPACRVELRPSLLSVQCRSEIWNLHVCFDLRALRISLCKSCNEHIDAESRHQRALWLSRSSHWCPRLLILTPRASRWIRCKDLTCTTSLAALPRRKVWPESVKCVGVECDGQHGIGAEGVTYTGGVGVKRMHPVLSHLHGSSAAGIPTPVPYPNSTRVGEGRWRANMQSIRQPVCFPSSSCNARFAGIVFRPCASFDRFSAFNPQVVSVSLYRVKYPNRVRERHTSPRRPNCNTIFIF